jgi:hypothetical protein
MTGSPKQSFRDAIAHLPTGVSVITTTAEGARSGMTASAVCSLSIEPLLLLVCIAQRSAMHDAIRKSRRFAVNVLPQGAAQLALTFAGPATTASSRELPCCKGPILHCCGTHSQHLLARFTSAFRAAIIRSSSGKLRPAPTGPAVLSCTSAVSSAVSTIQKNVSRITSPRSYET